jgi:hypothetical protein
MGAVGDDIETIKGVGKIGGAIAVGTDALSEFKRAEAEIKDGALAGPAVVAAGARVGVSSGASLGGGFAGGMLMGILSGGKPVDILAGTALGGFFAGNYADRGGFTESAGEAARKGAMGPLPVPSWASKFQMPPDF